MRYGVYLPTFGEYADPGRLASLAADAEEAGWDGVFTWDHMVMWWGRAAPVADTTVSLTAIALATSRVRLGALVTPIPRRRPWKLAREMVTLDRLSSGRLVFGAGLGANRFELEDLGEAEGLHARAAMLDEALEVLIGLWSGEPFSYEGEHYRVEAQFLPTPMQQPRIPIWVAVSWPNPKPLQRALRWDGAIVAMAKPGPFNTPVEVFAEIRERAGDRPFDLALANGNPEWDVEEDAEEVARYAEVGLTWWLEDIGPWRFGAGEDPPWPLEAMRERVLAGPPHL
jgi:alkanesulfonate monooxygenase SsuD/methylene tetrahydromethanopterin reductase-like flavin-dependent oxidoreductase (luciferase family)